MLTIFQSFFFRGSATFQSGGGGYGSLRPIGTVSDLAFRVLSIGNVVLYLLIALAVIFIVWQTVFYFIKSSESTDRKKTGMNIFWGIVGLFIIVSIWGLVNILVNTFWTDPRIPAYRFPNANFINSGTNNTGANTTTVPPPNSSINDVPYNYP